MVILSEKKEAPDSAAFSGVLRLLCAAMRHAARHAPHSEHAVLDVNADECRDTLNDSFRRLRYSLTASRFFLSPIPAGLNAREYARCPASIGAGAPSGLPPPYARAHRTSEFVAMRRPPAFHDGST